MMNTKKTLLIIFLILIISFASAEILVNTTINKESISTHEVAFLNITIYNMGQEINNYPIKIETSDNLVILENEQNVFFKKIETLKSNLLKEIRIRFKAIDTKEDIGKIFVYYGENLQFVSGTYIQTKELPVIINTNTIKENSNEGEKIFIEIEIQNNYSKPIYNVGAEVIAPKGFLIRTTPLFEPILFDQNKIKQTFEILAPLEVSGKHDFKISYGFFDENKPHYFEETITLNFEKRDNLILAIIGIIVLIITILIYTNKSNKKADVKGTEE